jgi:predicted transcriptional regulator/ribosomal protein S18 acetylase RimI-like enzyme
MPKSVRSTQSTGFLFPDSPPFKLVKLGETAARKQTDGLRLLESMLVANEPMYPRIAQWYKEKVVPGLRTRERIAYLAFEGEKPVASAILKLGSHAKFCHVRIQEGFRDLNLGRMIFTQLAFHARHQPGVKDIHFTLPESLWAEKSGFFSSFGFGTVGRASRQYRNGEEELYCSASLSTVWEHARVNLHLLEGFSPGGFSFSDKVVLSVHKKYSDLIFDGKKQVEIRRRFPTRLQGKQAVVYETQPSASLRGEVTIGAVVKGHPDEIWERFGSMTGCSYEEFASYAGSTDEIVALELKNLRPYLAPVGISLLYKFIEEDIRPPQSFLQVRSNEASPWSKAIAVAALLHSWR